MTRRGSPGHSQGRAVSQHKPWLQFGPQFPTGLDGDAVFGRQTQRSLGVVSGCHWLLLCVVFPRWWHHLSSPQPLSPPALSPKQEVSPAKKALRASSFKQKSSEGSPVALLDCATVTQGVPRASQAVVWELRCSRAPKSGFRAPKSSSRAPEAAWGLAARSVRAAEDV